MLESAILNSKLRTNTNAINKFILRFRNEFGMTLLRSFVMLNLVQHLFFLRRNDILFNAFVLVLFLSRNEHLFLNMIPLHFPSKGTSVNAKEQCSLYLIPLGLLKGTKDQLSFNDGNHTQFL